VQANGPRLRRTSERDTLEAKCRAVEAAIEPGAPCLWEGLSSAITEAIKKTGAKACYEDHKTRTKMGHTVDWTTNRLQRRSGHRSGSWTKGGVH